MESKELKEKILEMEKEKKLGNIKSADITEKLINIVKDEENL